MTLTPEDAEAIAAGMPGASRSAAPAVRARTQVVYGNRNWVPMFIYGTTPALPGSARLDGHGRRRAVHRPRRAQRQQGLLDRPDLVRELFQASRRSVKRSACRTSPSRWSACSPAKAPT